MTELPQHGSVSDFSERRISQLKKNKMKDFPIVETLEDLIDALHLVFEDDHINVEQVNDIMTAYRSNPREWVKYAKFDRHRYTRNLVDEGNGKFNLMVIAWAEGQGSSIHDHANSHCFMKMLAGNLREVRFAWPSTSEGTSDGTSEGTSDGTSEEVNSEEMMPIGETTLKTNDVCYINDSLGLHRMENVSHAAQAVSLHLYCPPFESVKVFDQRTGHIAKAKVTFWSKNGQRTPFGPTTGEQGDDYENN